MSQFQLTVATRANQALVLPVLLVASSINEARPTPVISITYEDTALLHEGEKAVVQFTGASGTPVFGTEKAVEELRSTFPYLSGKDEKLVRVQPYRLFCESDRLTASRKTSGFPSSSRSVSLTLRLLTLSSSASMHTSSCDLLSLGIRSPRRILRSGAP